MKRLENCLDKLVTKKLITKEDADFLVSEARSYEAEGLSPVEAERMAVGDAIEQTDNNGENVLEQIRANVPQAHESASEYWNRQTIRKVGVVPKAAPEAVPAPPAAPVVEAPPPVSPEAAPPAQPQAAPEAPAPEALRPPAPEAPVPEAQWRPSRAQWEVIDKLPEQQRDKLAAGFPAQSDCGPA